MVTFYDKKYNFFELFNEKNGFLLRSNKLNNGIETNEPPFLRSFPELLDIGIMGSCHCATEGICKNCGIDCYQNAINRKKTNMSIDDYNTIIAQARGATFQVALGGAGDPNKHEHFEEILYITRKAHIVPNMTTSGFLITDNEINIISKYCGAVAVSFYSKLTSNDQENNPVTIQAIEKLVRADCKTNIHYVLHKNNIKEAYYRVKNGLFPKGINAIVFLLYKPVGLGEKVKMLSANDNEYIEFLRALYNNKHPFKFGFDTCQSPALYNFCDFISKESLEFCEAGRFSMYIDSELKAYPCSFGIYNSEIMIDLRTHTLKEAWESDIFGKFRNKSNKNCERCGEIYCHNCPLDIGINVCGKVEH
jgi:MoaA/NifB/PqqE/SkfB family radical SAM enzyme